MLKQVSSRFLYIHTYSEIDIYYSDYKISTYIKVLLDGKKCMKVLKVYRWLSFT